MALSVAAYPTVVADWLRKPISEYKRWRLPVPFFVTIIPLLVLLLNLYKNLLTKRFKLLFLIKKYYVSTLLLEKIRVPTLTRWNGQADFYIFFYLACHCVPLLSRGLSFRHYNSRLGASPGQSFTNASKPPFTWSASWSMWLHIWQATNAPSLVPFSLTIFVQCRLCMSSSVAWCSEFCLSCLHLIWCAPTVLWQTLNFDIMKFTIMKADKQIYYYRCLDHTGNNNYELNSGD